MIFFQYSARVPLVIAGPGIVIGEAENACSLVDLLPSFLNIAGDHSTCWASRSTSAA